MDFPGVLMANAFKECTGTQSKSPNATVRSCIAFKESAEVPTESLGVNTSEGEVEKCREYA